MAMEEKGVVRRKRVELGERRMDEARGYTRSIREDKGRVRDWREREAGRG